jgi:hypothetical protein
MNRSAANASLTISARLAVCATSPDAAGAKPSDTAPPARTEVRIGPCGPPDHIERALVLCVALAGARIRTLPEE